MRFSGELTHIWCLQRSVLISCCISEAGWMDFGQRVTGNVNYIGRGFFRRRLRD